MTSSNAYTGSQSVRENTLVKSHAYCQQSFSQHTSYISRLLSFSQHLTVAIMHTLMGHIVYVYYRKEIRSEFITMRSSLGHHCRTRRNIPGLSERRPRFLREPVHRLPTGSTTDSHSMY